MASRTIWIAIVIGVASCDVGGRMSNQASVQAYEEEADAPPQGTVPRTGGEVRFRAAPEGSIPNPVEATTESVGLGRVLYGRACLHCHGENHDGEGAVGRRLHPLPADLRSQRLKDFDEDGLFRVVSFGSGRCPPLHATLAQEERWHIVNFLRSLPRRSGEKSAR